ncbi:MAG: NUDIX domain-containing protein [Nanoarchaeota archaeon]|nr:NUDIX domain-containing protein [Nanoarchaeota archaeon]
MEDFAGGEASFTVTLSGIILDPEKKKILIMRNPDGKKEWRFPQGILKAKTKIEDFLKRIFRKNLGCDIEIIGPVFSTILPERENSLHIHYLCEIVGRNGNVDKRTELKWISPDELKKYLGEFSESALEEYLTELV